MPVGYRAGGIVTGTLGEQILSRGDTKRSTKTNIKSHELAVVLGMVRERAQFYYKFLAPIHEHETGEELTYDEAKKLYPVIQEWEDVHQELVEHFVSVDGMSIRAVTQTYAEEVRGKAVEKEESSGKSERWN